MTKTLGVVPIGMLVLAAAVYGLVFPLNEMAAMEGAPYFAHAFWQTLVGGLALYGLSLARGERVSFRWPFLRAYVVVGAFGFSLPMALVTLASPKLPTGLVSLAFALTPTCTYVLSVIARLDRLSLYGFVGIALGFAGVAIILAPGSALPGASAVGWFLLTLIIPVMLAICNVAAALLRPPATSSTVMGAGFLLGAALSILPLMVLAGTATCRRAARRCCQRSVPARSTRSSSSSSQRSCGATAPPSSPSSTIWPSSPPSAGPPSSSAKRPASTPGSHWRLWRWASSSRSSGIGRRTRARLDDAERPEISRCCWRRSRAGALPRGPQRRARSASR